MEEGVVMALHDMARNAGLNWDSDRPGAQARRPPAPRNLLTPSRGMWPGRPGGACALGEAVAMTAPTIPLVEQPLRPLGRARATLKGRQSDEAALREVRALIGAAPEGGHRRDLLIENLHCLNDAFHGLFERHLVALAAEMRLAPVEVFEVASFYHHFEILKDDAAAPALVVRVCAGLSCEMAGARDLLARLPVLLGADVRVVEAPCIGRCEQAPAVLAGQQAVPQATPATVVAAVKALGAPDVPPGTPKALPLRKLNKLAMIPAQNGHWKLLKR
jgi:NADH:ubiquinone oxidoreductase subunit E